MSLFSTLEPRTLSVQRSKEAPKKILEGLSRTQNDPHRITFVNPHLESASGVKPEDGAERLKMKLRELLKDVRLKPVAKLDSILEGLILFGRDHTSDTHISAMLHAGFHLEPGSHTERQVRELLRVDAEHKNVSFSDPDVSPNAIPSSTAKEHKPAPQAASTSVPPTTSPDPTLPAHDHDSVPDYRQRKFAAVNKQHYRQSGSENISAPPRDEIDPDPGDIFIHHNVTAPSGQRFQAWLCEEKGKWTEISDAFNKNARIEYPPGDGRILVMKGDNEKLELNWLIEDRLKKNSWKNWDKPSWAA